MSAPPRVNIPGLTPLRKRALLEVVTHGEMTAREVALDLRVREHTARQTLKRLEGVGLTVCRYNGRTLVHCATSRGRALVEQWGGERLARAEHEASLAAAVPTAIVTCPTCDGERVYCTTCLGTRLVVEGSSS